MTTKPDDIPQGIWERADDLAFFDPSAEDRKGNIDRYKLREAIARAILKAKNEALEKAATIADELFLDHTENHGDLYADDISQAIRSLKHKAEV